jgi:hypothetical protein
LGGRLAGLRLRFFFSRQIGRFAAPFFFLTGKRRFSGAPSFFAAEIWYLAGA